MARFHSEHKFVTSQLTFWSSLDTCMEMMQMETMQFWKKIRHNVYIIIYRHVCKVILGQIIVLLCLVWDAKDGYLSDLRGNCHENCKFWLLIKSSWWIVLLVVLNFLKLCIALFKEMFLFRVCNICSSCYCHLNLAFRSSSTPQHLRRCTKNYILQKLFEISAWNFAECSFSPQCTIPDIFCVSV